jgi:hypothetical protein
VEYLMGVLPTVEVPRIEGTTVEAPLMSYAVDGIRLDNIHIRKEDVQVAFGSGSRHDPMASVRRIRRGEAISITFEGLTARIDQVRWDFKMLQAPYLSGGGLAKADVLGLTVRIVDYVDC